MNSTMNKIVSSMIVVVAVLINFSCDDLNDFEQGTFNGRVLDAVTGEGLADIDVTLEPVLTANGNAITKPDGQFNLSRIVAGFYKVRVKKNGASILGVIEEGVVIANGQILTEEYQLTPRVSVSQFTVDYDRSDPTTFTVRFKATGNEGNKFTYYSVMWDKYPDYIFSKLPASQKKAVKYTATESADVSYEVKGISLEKGTTYYIRVGVTHIAGGGDYNHSNVVAITFK